MSEPVSLPIHGQVHHYGYVVADLDHAIEEMISKFGAGPFFIMKNVPVENVTSQGGPAVFSHSSAFGQFGDVPVELMQIHHCDPASVREGFSQSPPQLHHVAWVVPSLAPAIESLERQDMPMFLRADVGDIHFAYHDAGRVLGHHVELHHDTPSLRGFFGMIREANEGWDGSDPVRTPSF